MRRLGYVSPTDERQRYEQWQAGVGTKPDAVMDQTAKEASTRAELEFEEALNQLPIDADQKVEINWIRNHPAMARKARLQNQEERVLITAPDILNPSHGPAPSRSAAIQLQNWADNPSEFNKQLAGLVKRMDGGESQRDDGCIEDDGIAEVERIYREFFSPQGQIDAAIKTLTNHGYTVIRQNTEQTATPS